MEPPPDEATPPRLLTGLFDSPDLYLYKLEDEPIACFGHMDRDSYVKSSFLDHRPEPRPGRRRGILRAHAAARPRPRLPRPDLRRLGDPADQADRLLHQPRP